MGLRTAERLREELGSLPVFVKPFNFRQLLAACEAGLGAYRARSVCRSLATPAIFRPSSIAASPMVRFNGWMLVRAAGRFSFDSTAYECSLRGVAKWIIAADLSARGGLRPSSSVGLR